MFLCETAFFNYANQFSLVVVSFQIRLPQFFPSTCFLLTVDFFAHPLSYIHSFKAYEKVLEKWSMLCLKPVVIFTAANVLKLSSRRLIWQMAESTRVSPEEIERREKYLRSGMREVDLTDPFTWPHRWQVRFIQFW